MVGAGAVGLWCACTLAEAGLRVTVLERRHPGAGASWGNAGWVVPSHSVPLAHPGALRRGLRWLLDPESPLYVPLRLEGRLWSWLWQFRRFSTPAHVRRAVPLLVRLQRRSAELYGQLAAQGLEFGWQRAGSMSTFLDPQEYRGFLDEVELLRQEGVAAEEMDAPSAREWEPLLRAGLAGAVYFPEDGHLDPAALVAALAQRAVQLGAKVQSGTEVRLRADGRKVTVETPTWRAQPQLLVVAAGVWSALLLRGVGVRLPVVPAKGYSITVDGQAGPCCPLMLTEARVAVTPLRGPDGSPRVRLAGTLELGVWDSQPRSRRVDAIRKAVGRYLQLDPQGGEVWAGLRPCTPDGLPVVGRPRALDNLLVATGHGTLGISLAPATAELVAQLARGEDPEEVRLLRPDRFG